MRRARAGEIELAGVLSSTADLAAAEAARDTGGLRSYSYANEMRIFAHNVQTRAQPTCTGEIGHNALAATILGTEAQLARVYREFDAGTFA